MNVRHCLIKGRRVIKIEPYAGLPHVSEKFYFFSSSGKCQGILKFVREKLNFGKCQGKLTYAGKHKMSRCTCKEFADFRASSSYLFLFPYKMYMLL